MSEELSEAMRDKLSVIADAVSHSANEDEAILEKLEYIARKRPSLINLIYTKLTTGCDKASKAVATQVRHDIDTMVNYEFSHPDSWQHHCRNLLNGEMRESIIRAWNYFQAEYKCLSFIPIRQSNHTTILHHDMNQVFSAIMRNTPVPNSLYKTERFWRGLSLLTLLVGTFDYSKQHLHDPEGNLLKFIDLVSSTPHYIDIMKVAVERGTFDPEIIKPVVNEHDPLSEGIL